MKLKEKLAEKSLFELMDSHKPFSWKEKFSPSEMESLFIYLYGEHEINKAFEDFSVEEMANNLADFFVDRWNKIFTFYFDENLFNVGFSETYSETENTDGTTTENNTGNEVNKVSAYNVETFSNDTSRDTTDTKNGTDTRKHTREYKRQGYNDGFAESRLKYINRLQNDFIYAIIFKEVKTLITNPIYL